MSVFKKIRGTIESIFQLGLGGPNLKQETAGDGSLVIAARNTADGAYTRMRGAAPTENYDLANKTYVDTLASRTIVSAQHNGGVALPANSVNTKFYVVTTTGGFASIGDVLWDDGSGVGNVSVIPPTDSKLIITTQAFTGGTISLGADSLYTWDSTTSAWLNAGGPSTSGTIRMIRYAVTNAATQDSATVMPANAVVRRAVLDVLVPYSGGAQVKIGIPGSLSLLQATTDNSAQAANLYEVDQDTPVGGVAAVVRTTVTGAPAAGSGFVLVEYSLPDA